MSTKRNRGLAPLLRRLVPAFGGLMLLLGLGPATPQDMIELVHAEPVPKEDFRSWALFLVCTPDWVMPERSADLANLYGRFRAFGDAIGSDNAAVWFWKATMPLDSDRLARNVDVARSTEYCRKLRLRPSQGPFLVVTLKYPELADFPKERAVYSLGGLTLAQLADLLNTLTDQLLLEEEVAEARESLSREREESSGETTTSAASSGFWIQLLEGTRRGFAGIGCAVSLRINAGFLNAEIKGCVR